MFYLTLDIYSIWLYFVTHLFMCSVLSPQVDSDPSEVLGHINPPG